MVKSTPNGFSSDRRQRHVRVVVEPVENVAHRLLRDRQLILAGGRGSGFGATSESGIAGGRRDDPAAVVKEIGPDANEPKNVGGLATV